MSSALQLFETATLAGSTSPRFLAVFRCRFSLVLAHPTRRTAAQTFLFQNRQGGPMHRRTVERLTGIWGRNAGVVNCIPHRFRHSFGTELLRNTRDIKAVQEALGHADIGSTMGYTELANDRLAQAIQTLSWGET